MYDETFGERKGHNFQNSKRAEIVIKQQRTKLRLPIFRVLKQQNLQIGWKLCKDVQVAGTDGQMAEWLQTGNAFSDHTFFREPKKKDVYLPN